MPTKQDNVPPNTTGATPGPTLDESLAQLEVALDLFATHQDEAQYEQPQMMDEVPSITPIRSTPYAPLSEPAAVAAAPIRDESFEQTIHELKRKIASPETEGIAPLPVGEVVVRAPEDEEGLTRRRFPLFTDTQKRLMLLAVAILAFFALIGYLIWQRQQTDELKLALEREENARLLSAPVVAPSITSPVEESSPPPPLSQGDQGLLENVRQILHAYNPTAAETRYKIEVKDGVVTLNGEAQSQLEKDGVESVIKPLSGINKVVNNLAVKLPGAPGSMKPGGEPFVYPPVNAAEAKRLEESLKRDLAEAAKRADDERLRIEQQNSQLAAQQNRAEPPRPDTARAEADRAQRQQTAAIHNEEDAAFRRLAEERLKQREKEEAERRAEEQRKTEAGQKSEPPRTETPTLRSGTVTWHGLVKGVEDIVIRGSSASVQHVSGATVKDAKGVFSAAIPNAPISVRLVAASGPSPIRIIQQPSTSNNFTTIVRVGEGNKGEGKPHTFTLRWSSQ